MADLLRPRKCDQRGPRRAGTAAGANGNITAVMDGDIDGFINAYLTASATGELKKKYTQQEPPG